MHEPTPGTQRIELLDVTRGVAVLGILLMNVIGFGLPNAYDDPTNWGGAEGANLVVWRMMSVSVEGTMRGLFSLLFGAGMLLFLDGPAGTGREARPTRLYTRRVLWLLLFGLLNAYVLLWDGDILFAYGVTGLLLLAFRRLPAPWLMACAFAALALQTTISTFTWLDYRELQRSAQVAHVLQAAGRPPPAELRAAADQYAATNEQYKPSRAAQEEIIAFMRGSYASAANVVRDRARYTQTTAFLRHGLLDFLGMMLLGMALLRLGIITGRAPTHVYAALLIAGYGIGLSVNLLETRAIESSGFAVHSIVRSYLTYDLGRVAMTLGHLALIALLHRAPTVKAMRPLAAVGRLALTNYLAQSLIGLFVFTGAGLALFGQLERHQLYYVVLAVWMAQLLWSSAWLRSFRFGPAEWLWRSLTYWRLQPMKTTGWTLSKYWNQ
ncbi:MAG TPA: DUF418 domain-containing protein [Steroidobacter sp.]|jgi:uncharacterized protein|nr:DUF418 domain-containing protein [Steroidobacteraceae bacterium]HLS83018.1 DUF418 domain-containing protein [Steroidobacter sp.]